MAVIGYGMDCMLTGLLFEELAEGEAIIWKADGPQGE